MTFTMLINLEKVIEWDLSKTTIFIMGAFADLESWAIKYKSNDAENDDFYYLLYRSKILKDLPFLGSASSVSRGIKELEDKGIIKSINKHSNPAYCLTEKGMTWKRKPDGGEKTPPSPKHKTPPKTKSKFSLGKKSRFDATSDEYRALIQQECLKYCSDNNASTEEFNSFIDWHVSKGSVFVNWLSAFRNWVRKANKINSSKATGVLDELEL